MKKKGFPLLILAVVLQLWAAGCLPKPTPAPDSAGQIPAAVLVEQQGSILYKRPGWKVSYPLSIGALLQPGDLLETGPGYGGLVVCPDLRTAEIPSNYVGPIPCRQDDPVPVREGSYVVKPRRGSDHSMVEVPYVISPRFTFLLTGQPVLRWNPTGPEGESYEVRVRGGSVDWKATVKGSQVEYPLTAPPLKAGEGYQVSVTDSRGNFSGEENAEMDLTFGLLSAERIKSYQEIQKQVEGLPLSRPEARSLVMVEVDESFGLRADAIEELDRLASKVTSPWIDFRLGELYHEIGLYEESLRFLEEARKEFAGQENPAGEAQALLLSGLCYQEMQNNEQAKRLYAESLRLWTSMGDTEQAGNVQRLLK